MSVKVIPFLMLETFHELDICQTKKEHKCRLKPPELIFCEVLSGGLRESSKTTQRIFSVKGVPPPTPLAENHSSKKPLAEMGGTRPPPPLNGKSA